MSLYQWHLGRDRAILGSQDCSVPAVGVMHSSNWRDLLIYEIVIIRGTGFKFGEGDIPAFLIKSM